MFKVIVINGSGTSGKDKFVECFAKACKNESEHCLVRSISSVEEVKYYARKMGWDNNKDERGRRFLSDLKDALTRYSDAPFRFVKSCVDSTKSMYEGYLERYSDTKCFVFVHIREPEEIKRAVEEFNALSLLIDRPQVKPCDFDNHADQYTMAYDYDYCIMNDFDGSDVDKSLSALYEQSALFLDFLIKQGGEENACTEAELQIT